MPINSEQETIYLVSLAAQAHWETGELMSDRNSMSGNTVIQWQGSDADSNGFARSDAMSMEDNGIYTALRMHPKWLRDGTIKGWFPPVLLSGNGTFKARIGFLAGATGSDGVSFQVWVHFWDVTGTEHWINVLTQSKAYDGTLADIAVDLSRWAKQQISIELRVDAGASSGQDWAAWVDPRIELVRQPGPVIRNPDLAGSSILDDRYTDKLKWYLPVFTLPLQKDYFSLTCTANGIHTYKGTIRFQLGTAVPSFVADYMRDHPDVNCREIPVDSLDADFNLQINGVQTPFRAALTYDQPAGKAALILDIPTQEGLIMIYDAISNAQWAAFCSLAIHMTCSGHEPVSGKDPVRLNIARRFMKRAAIQPVNILIPGLLHRTVAADLNLQRPAIRFRTPIHIPGKRVATSPEAVTPEPVVDNHDPYIFRSAYAFAQTIAQVSFPCRDFPDNYCIQDQDNVLVPFACKPPFPAASANMKTYQELAGTAALQALGVSAIYRHTINNSFLIIPQRYVIALAKTGNIFIPACYLFTTVDANGVNKSNATFKFDIVPDISAYQLMLIRQQLFDRFFTKELQKTLDDVVIDFPQKMKDTVSFVANQPLQTSVTPMGIYEWGIPGNKYFHIEFRDVAIGDGTADTVSMRLKTAGGELVAQLLLDIDSDTTPNPQSAILLSLLAVNGNGLSLKKDDTEAQWLLANKTLYDVAVRNIVTAGGGAGEACPLAIPANTKVVAPDRITAATAIDATYTANEAYINQVLYEKRFTTDQQVKDTLVVTNNSGLFGSYRITKIDLYVSIVQQGESDPEKALTNAYLALTGDGAINAVEFTLPVAGYQSQWSVFYKTVIHFDDDTVQDNDPQVIEDINAIGKIINLTVSNLNLA